MKPEDDRGPLDAGQHDLRDCFRPAEAVFFLDPALSTWRQTHCRPELAQVADAVSELGRRMAESLHALCVPPVFPAELVPSRSMLSRREAQVAALLAAGFSTSQTARILRVRATTVRRHTANVYAKLCISSRRQLTEVLHESLT